MNELTPVSRTRIVVPINGVTLAGELSLPEKARGLVIFAHDTPGSRHCVCNTVVAGALHAVGVGSLLFDLLSEAETASEAVRSRLGSDIPVLAGRLVSATRWIIADPLCRDLRLGYCGSGAGGAAALVAAAWLGNAVDAVVARAAHTDRADGALGRVVSASLLVVGEGDADLRRHNEEALSRMGCVRELAVVAGTSDLFSESEALNKVAGLAADWFDRHLHSS